MIMRIGYYDVWGHGLILEFVIRDYDWELEFEIGICD